MNDDILYPSLIPDVYRKEGFLLCKSWRKYKRENVLKKYTRYQLYRSSLKNRWTYSVITSLRDYVILDELPKHITAINRQSIYRNICVYLSLKNILPDELIRYILDKLKY